MAFLIMGHPGHELRVHHWLERARPRVFVLTDGAGADGVSRTHRTGEAIAAAGARAGSVFAAWTDRGAYRMLLAKDAAPFVRVGRAILDDARNARPALIVSDALEGYNPMHDMAWALASAVSAALQAEGQAVEHLVFPVAEPTLAGILRLQHALDAPALARKIDAARAYEPLRHEVEAYLAKAGPSVAFEPLFPAEAEPPADWRPHYESVGRARVAAGRYETALEYHMHLRPVFEAVRLALSDGCLDRQAS